MFTADLDYHLPPQQIATEPAQPRDAARLMIIDRHTGRVEHRHVHDLSDNPAPTPSCVGSSPLRPGDLLVFNQSRVLPACFSARRAATGGRVGGLYLALRQHAHGCHWLVMLETGGSLRAGEQIDLTADSSLELVENHGGGQWLAKLTSPDDTLTLLNRIGSPPLPPYILRQRRDRHQDEAQPQDADRYNTVFATDPGSIAAPTAGLHFTQALLSQLDQIGLHQAMVTLHVGLGTFAPVRTTRLQDHPIHPESITVPAATIAAIRATRQSGGRIIPVGTTTVRALESLPNPLPATGDHTGSTRLFVMPDDETGGFPFRFTDALLTNFHLPRSTLLAMVAALPGVGLVRLKSWYQIAIDHGYRFYSFGDAMLIL